MVGCFFFFYSSTVLSAKGVHNILFPVFYTTVHLQACDVHDILCSIVKERLGALASALEYSGLNNLTLQGSFYSIHSPSRRPLWQAFSVFFFSPPLCFFCIIICINWGWRRGVGGGQKWDSNVVKTWSSFKAELTAYFYHHRHSLRCRMPLNE